MRILGRVSLRALSCLILALTVDHCRTVGVSPVSLAAARSADRPPPAFATLPELWQNTKRDNFAGKGDQKNLPATDTLTQWLQQKLDVIWDALLAEGHVPKGIPRPTVVVTAPPYYNGYVSAVKACVAAPMGVTGFNSEGSVYRANFDVDLQEFIDFPVFAVGDPDQFKPCASTVRGEAAFELLKVWNDGRLESCEIRKTTLGAELGRGCLFKELRDDDLKKLRFEGLNFSASSNIIHLGLGFLQQLDARHAMFFLAHDGALCTRPRGPQCRRLGCILLSPGRSWDFFATEFGERGGTGPRGCGL